MSKPTASTILKLRAAAEKAVSKWQELKAVADAATEQKQKLYRDRPLPLGSWTAHGRPAKSNPVILEHLRAELAEVEALAPCAEAERDAVEALNALELATGDEAAIARDLPTLRAALLEDDAKIAAAKAAYQLAYRAAEERVLRAQQAEMVTMSRRRAGGLPHLPTGFAATAPGAATIAAIDTTMARGLQVPNHAGRATQLRGDMTRIAADLEEARLEREAEVAEQKRAAGEKAHIQKLESQRTAAQNKKLRDAAVAEEKRRAKLAADFLGRAQ